MYIAPCQRHKTPGRQNTCFPVFSLTYIDFQDFNMILRMYITVGQRHKDLILILYIDAIKIRVS